MKLLGSLALCFSLLSIGAGHAQPAANRPNVIFILADDLGYMDISPNNPKTFYRTPSLERLASQGMRFTQAYAACPVCSPTRASILTGKYPARLGLTDYIGRHARGKLLPSPTGDHLPLEEVTLAEAFKAAGYRTACVGKWHLGGEGFLPENQGFDVNVGAWQAGHPPSYFSPYKNPKLSDGPPGEYLTDRLTSEAIKFIETNKTQPFFLYFSHYAVHTPLQGKAELVERYRKKAESMGIPDDQRFGKEGASPVRLVQDHPVYAAMVESMDQSIGRVLDTLQALKLRERTIVIFFSDNGGLSTAEGTPTSNLPLRGGKGWLYEGGIREPLIVSWPGSIRPGTLSDMPVTSTDFYPTLLDLLGLPPKPAQHRDGTSFASLLKTGAPVSRGPLFWHYPHYGNQGGQPGAVVRAGDFKLIRFFEDNHQELYNLREDLGEKHNLAGSMPDKVEELARVLNEKLKETGAILPKENPEWDPAQGVVRGKKKAAKK